MLKNRFVSHGFSHFLGRISRLVPTNSGTFSFVLKIKQKAHEDQGQCIKKCVKRVVSHGFSVIFVKSTSKSQRWKGNWKELSSCFGSFSGGNTFALAKTFPDAIEITSWSHFLVPLVSGGPVRYTKASRAGLDKRGEKSRQMPTGQTFMKKVMTKTPTNVNIQKFHWLYTM